MKSQLLKTEALCWMRFCKKMDLVCTEGGRWSSDVLGVCDTYSIEVETKISRADLLAEFRNKKHKHAVYKAGLHWSPNYFYFLVTPEMGEGTVELIEEKFPQAGVLIYKYPGFRPGDRLECLKKAKKLHTKKPAPEMKRAVLLRMGSELCGMHVALDMLDKSAMTDPIEDVKQSIVSAVIDAFGAQDWEKNDEAEGNEHAHGTDGDQTPGSIGE